MALRTISLADASFALAVWLMNAGIAIAQRMPITRQTTRSSINEKPASLRRRRRRGKVPLFVRDRPEN